MDDYGNSLLHCAVEENQIESVKFLLSRGANPNLQNFNMMAPLHLAVQGTHNEVMKVLLEHGSTDVNLEGENGNTAVMIACTKNNSEALKILISLAAGDIAEVQKHASLKRIAMQVELHTSLETTLSCCCIRKVDRKSTTIYPNKPRCGGTLFLQTLEQKESSIFTGVRG
ncbi:transient receptor potential cation channel subfamily A member 1-like [Papio anubis]|uniref:transient receptor potential cation channel subfamily A member 1-like n=1 Tax=Papio anubis TaxID=9555 RepID=UPI0012ADB35B|nr:transient receptor potential cation channel subfamily A member 1-like [Papio anubis]